MRAKNVVSAVLLLFVAVSLVYLVAGNRKDQTAPAVGTADSGAAPAAVSSTGPPPAARVIAYYFHGTIRCRTCLAIENTAHEVLRAEFADEFADGTLEWRTVDMEDPDNERFVEGFELAAAGLVLAEERGGTVIRWENLEEVWSLIGEEERFGAYVAGHTRAFLDET